MARCKLCKKDISDGTEYCTDCIDKKDIISNESYLDSLLDSVQGGTATARDIYKIKKEKSSGESSDFGALNDSIVNNADEISGDINKIDNVNNSETD